jgi:hypothetical protein
MIRPIPLIVAVLFILGSKGGFNEYPPCTIYVADTIPTLIYLEYDSLGLPDVYKSRIITPVCETDRCYAIEIDFYWDLMGRFVRYDTVAGMGLTKLDHVPFTEEDYEKLNALLADRNSLLVSFSRDDLVKDTRNSALDGLTGATVREVRDAVINGAAYSCYTLWHVANGPVIDTLQNASARLFTRDLVKKLVNQHDQEVNYYLLDNLSEEDFLACLSEILETIQHGKGYYTKHAIEMLPTEAFGKSLVQDFFAASFDQLDYFAQVALLKRIGSIPLHQSLELKLQEQVKERDSYRNDLIRSILSGQQH